jgi:hypothetical protein
MGKTGKTRSERGGAKRRRTVLFKDGLGALSVAAFLFLGATIREVNLLMALGAFFAGFAVLDYWQGRRSLRRLRVARRLPDAIFAGEPFEVEFDSRFLLGFFGVLPSATPLTYWHGGEKTALFETSDGKISFVCLPLQPPQNKEKRR